MTGPAVDTALIAVSPGETRSAFLADGRLWEYVVDRRALGLGSRVGNVYLGRVTRTVDTLGAAFVAIDGGPPGFLSLSDARPPGIGAADGQRITDFAAEGDAVIVQVAADAVADKGPKLTTRVTLPGLGLVLAPGQNEIKLSRRIDGDSERQRLVDLAADLVEADDGVILRHTAAGLAGEVLATEIGRLRKAWHDIKAQANEARAPALLRRADSETDRAIGRWGGSLRRIVTDDRGLAHCLRDRMAPRMPCLPNDVDLWTGTTDLLEAEGIGEQIDAALSPLVPLPGGGSLIVEPTAALVAIDVNSGDANALTTNLEAVAEVARQVRLRGLAGQIVVDLLPMKRRNQRDRILAAMRTALAVDPRPAHVLGFSGLGLLEMTRERRGPSLADNLLAACPTCDGRAVASPLTTALAALRGLLRTVGGGAPVPMLTATPAVIEALRGVAGPALAQTEQRIGAPLALAADSCLAPDAFVLAPQQPA